MTTIHLFGINFNTWRSCGMSYFNGNIRVFRSRYYFNRYKWTPIVFISIYYSKNRCKCSANTTQCDTECEAPNNKNI